MSLQIKKRKLSSIVLHKFRILIILFISFFITNANAITIPELSASVIYGKNESLAEACRMARDAFFDKARRQASGGETISLTQLKFVKKAQMKIFVIFILILFDPLDQFKLLIINFLNLKMMKIAKLLL